MKRMIFLTMLLILLCACATTLGKSRDAISNSLDSISVGEDFQENIYNVIYDHADIRYEVIIVLLSTNKDSIENIARESISIHADDDGIDLPIEFEHYIEITKIKDQDVIDEIMNTDHHDHDH